MQIDIHELLAEEDKVVAYFTFNGTDLGGYGAHPPSDKRVTYSGMGIFRLAEGKIVERWGIVDTVSMLNQIGALS